MKLFVSDTVHDKEIVDTIFEASQSAIEASIKYGAENIVNGAFGTFFTESGKLMTFETVYRAFDEVDNIQKAKYAASILGSPEYINGVKDWLFKAVELDIDCDVIATPGGTGALSSTIKNTLMPGQTVIYPDISWGPYMTIAREQGTPITSYTLFEEGNFNITSFRDTCLEVMKSQGKVLAFINDPCQNPTGYTMRDDEWDQVIEIVKEISELGPFILLHDIAYIDFNADGDHYKKRAFQRYKDLPENVLIVIAFSVSKTLTAYGMRVGAQVLISSNLEQRKKLMHACGNTARGVWSTVNNGGMRVFADIAKSPELKIAYLQEKAYYVSLLQERANLFIEEAKAVGLPIYPFKEGFFVTIKIDNQVVKNELHLKLKTLNIFFVNVYGGLRVAVCSIPKSKLKGLATKVMTALEQLLEVHS